MTRLRFVPLTIVVLMLPGLAAAAELGVPSDFPTIQSAIAAADDGDVIVVAPGTYPGTVNPLGKPVTIRSSDPDDPLVVAQTVIDGAGERAVEFFSGEGLDTVLEGLTITGGSDELGGGVAIYGSGPIIRKCVIRDNTATKGGGAYLSSSSAWFDDCTFIDNSAVDGGGVYAYAAGSVRFDGCTFVGNSASSDGGAIASTFADLRFHGCLIAENSADRRGGAFDSDHTVVRFVNSLLRDNVAERGGAIAVDDDNPQLLNSTVVRNTATGDGGGGAIFGIMSQPIIRNSIVRDNAPDELGGFAVNPAAEYSNVTGGLPGPGNIDADPLFVDPAGDDFRLQDGSPSRDGGLDGWVPSYGSRDLDGAPRVLEAAVDMGAYEVQGVPATVPQGPGSLIVAVRDDGSLVSGLESPLLRYDLVTGEWTEIVRNLPAYAIAADPFNRCFWVHSGENGLLGRVPYDTLELEEIGVLTYEGSASMGLSGMAVRDGVLYGTVWLVGAQADRLYTIDTETATLSLVAEFPPDFEIWDLHHDAEGDRLLVLSSPETVPPGPLGIYEVDLQTFALSQVQSFFNGDPFSQLNALQGLATGQGVNFIFRSPYNAIELYDAESQALIDTISVPDSVPIPGAGWLLGGLTWAPQPSGEIAPVAPRPDRRRLPRDSRSRGGDDGRLIELGVD